MSAAPRSKMLHLRMDDELHDALGEYARKNRRSLTNALEFILADALRRNDNDVDHHRQYA